MLAFASAIEPLRAANRLTGQTLFDVAVACGFAFASHFSRCYRTLYGCKPSGERTPAPVTRARVLRARRP